MWYRRNNWKSIALLVVVSVVACSSVARAQTWSTPQFIANGFGIAVATNGAPQQFCSCRPPEGCRPQ